MDYHIFKSLLNGFYAAGSAATIGRFSATSTPFARRCTPSRGRIARFVPNSMPYSQVALKRLSRGRHRRGRHFCRRCRQELVGVHARYSWSQARGKSGVSRATCRVLEGVPNLLQAFFSVLDPGKSIPLHKGPYLGYLRYHLGLHSPQSQSAPVDRQHATLCLAQRAKRCCSTIRGPMLSRTRPKRCTRQCWWSTSCTHAPLADLIESADHQFGRAPLLWAARGGQSAEVRPGTLKPSRAGDLPRFSRSPVHQSPICCCTIAIGRQPAGVD